MLAETLAVTLQVTGVLESLDVTYALGGSVASALHGVVRATLDADIIADLEPAQAEPLANALAGDFYVDLEAVRAAIAQHRSFNVIHLDSMFKVDIFVARPRALDRAQLARRRTYVVDPEAGRSFYVISAEDLILAKLDWYRLGGETSERQWSDVLGVLQAQAGRLDLEYLHRMAEAVGVSDLLARALNAVP